MAALKHEAARPSQVSEIDVRSTPRATTQLIPELVLFLFTISLGRFLEFRSGVKAELGVLLILLASTLIRVKRPLNALNKFTYLPPLGLLTVVVLTYRYGPYTRFAAVIIIFLILFSLVPVTTRESAGESLMAGLTLYMCANILGWMAGIESPSAYGRLFGYDTTSPFFNKRIIFPFSVSLNEPPYMAAAFLAAVLAMIKIRRPLHWYHYVGTLAAVFMMLAANNRTSTLIITALSLMIFLTPNALRAFSPYAIGAALLAPIFLGITKPFKDFFANILQANQFFGRGGTQASIADLSGRDAIWEGVIRFLTKKFNGVAGINDIPPLLFGYGEQGQIKSGAYLFIPRAASEFLQHRTFLHAHNSMLQLMLDAGLIGAMITWAVAVLLIYRYRSEANSFPILVASLIVVSAGVVESNLAPGMNDIAFYAFVYLAFFIPVRMPPQTTRRVAGNQRTAETPTDTGPP